MSPYRIATIAGLLIVSGCTRHDSELLVATMRGHEEVAVEDDGSLVPLILEAKNRVGLCVKAAAAQDTSQWTMTISLAGRPSPSGAVAPAARSGSTVCFDATLPEGLPAGTFDVCARLVDSFDGSPYAVACQPARLLGDVAGYEATRALLDQLLPLAYDVDHGELIERLDAIACQAAEHGFALLAVQVTSISVHFLTLEGTPAALAEAGRRLESLPDWLDKPAACHQAALASYQRAIFYLDAEGRVEEAWAELAVADRYYQEIADAKRFTVTMAQASILHHHGLIGEAVDRLRRLLEESELRLVEGSSALELVEAARNNLAWYILMNPDASAAELEEAQGYLDEDAGDPATDVDRLEIANRRINRAFLEVRQGRNPQVALASARDMLAELQMGTERGEYLEAWARLVEGTEALGNGDAASALGHCSSLAENKDPHLAAWASRCSARAYRLAGDLEAASSAVEQALALAYQTTPLNARAWMLGPSYRAEDFALAAALAIERGEPGKAWKLLFELDQLSIGETRRRVCRERALGRDRARWEAIDAEMAAILREVRSLEQPASQERRVQQKELRDERKVRLQELWRQWPGCEEPPHSSDEGLLYRAFAVEEEIILLGRPSPNDVRLARRTPFPRARLRQLHDRILAAFDRGTGGGGTGGGGTGGGGTGEGEDDTWRQLVAEIAPALLPETIEDDTVLTYALHGLLQTVPLHALPVTGATGGSEWLGLRALVAVHPAGARANPSHPAGQPQPLFVVDPSSNLPAAPKLLATYRAAFPKARILTGVEATYDAFRREVSRAQWLHVDAHGIYDPVFPRLSALQLADRRIYWFELAARSMNFRFAHLSGCHTGRWPVTPDSGTYGIAGLVTRLGVEWAVASRAGLDDAVAQDFNAAFYRAIGEGLSVAAAYREGLRKVAGRYPASAWARLVLLHAAGSTEA